MNKNRYFLTFTTLSILVFIVAAFGCAPAVTTPPAAKPAITSFTATPASISQGQQTALSWNVSGVAQVDIQPGIGNVGGSGLLTLTPNATVTYTLTATNAAGSATSSVTINVTPVVAGQPDLAITEVSLIGDTIYYILKNEGTAEAAPTWANLYINGAKQDENFQQALAPGQQRTGQFSAYKYVHSYVTTAEGIVFPPQTVQICIDETNKISDIHQENNCISQTWGQTFSYDFKYNAGLATWRSSLGDLTWFPQPRVNPDGAAYLFLGDLTMCVPQQTNGWILGRYADFFIDPETTKALSREIVMPANCKFTAQLGFAQGVKSTDGVKVALGYLNDQFSMVLFPGIVVNSDGQLHPYEVDLNSLAGKKTEFFLFVEANGSPQGDCVKWVDPKIIQQ